MKIRILAMSSFIALAASTDALASNWNQCIQMSDGLAGGQFKNACRQPVALYFGPAGMSSGWRKSEINPGAIKVFSSYTSNWIACPIEDNGRPVRLNQKTKDCEIER